MIGFNGFEENDLRSKKLALAFQLIGIGWYVTACIIGGTFLGSWISKFFNFSNADVLFLMSGLLIGILTAGIGTYNLVKSVLKSD